MNTKWLKIIKRIWLNIKYKLTLFKTMKIFSKFEFDTFSNTDDISDSTKLDYIKEMIAFSKNDKQSVFMYFAFALAVVVFAIEKLDPTIQSAGVVYKSLFYTGISFLIVSSISFFIYWRKTHEFQNKMISCIPKLNIEKVRDLWIRLWDENKVFFKLGLLLLIVGCSFVFVISLIVKLIL